MDHATLVENAVKRFYISGDNEAHSWLLRAQASKEAWTFVWQLLDASKSPEVQFFAANTLYTKISKQWEEVPKSDYLELRACIYEIIKRPRTSALVLTRLCEALAAFMVHYSALQDENEPKCVVEHIMEMLPYNSRETVALLLKVLEAIPKQADHCASYDENVATLGKQRKSVLPNWYKIVWILQQIFSSCSQVQDSESDSLFILGIECCLSWLRLGHLPPDTIGQIYPYLLIAASKFSPKSDDMESENLQALEAVKDCLKLAVTHPDLLWQRPLLFWEWAEGLVCMVKENNPQNFYEVLTVIGEAHSRSILLGLIEENPALERQRWTAQQIIEFLFQCSEQPGRYPTEERHSCMPFGFWYALQDDLSGLDNPVDEKAHNALMPIYSRVVQTLLKKCTLPSSPSEAGTDDERELFRCYRQDVADTLCYSFRVIDKDLYKLLIEKLNQPHDVSKWVEIEAAIFGFKAVSDSVLNEKHDSYIKEIINLLLSHIPYTMYPRDVLCSACWAVGEYAFWLADNPEFLERALQLAMLGLTDGPTSAPAASMALKDITRECEKHLGPVAPSLLNTIGRLLQEVEAGSSEALRLMYAASKLLMSVTEEAEQLRYLEATVGLCLMRLRELLQMPISEAHVTVENQLKMVTTFFTTFDGSESTFSTVLEAFLLIFEGIVNHPDWGVEDNTTEAIFNCLQKAVSSLYNSELKIKRLINLILTSYKKRPHPGPLNLFKIVMGLSRHLESDVLELLKNALEEINALTLGGVAACRQTGGNLSDLCDLLEAYMSMLANLCRKNARLLLFLPDQVPEMLQCGMACILLPEGPVQRAAGNFLTQAVSQSPHLQTFIHPIGQELACVLMQCVKNFSTTREQRFIESVAQVLLAMNIMCNASKMTQWLNFALADYPLEEKNKDLFIKSIIRQRVSKVRMCQILRELGTLYWDATKHQIPIST